MPALRDNFPGREEGHKPEAPAKGPSLALQACGEYLPWRVILRASAAGRDELARLEVCRDEPLVGGAVTRFLVAPPGLLERVDVPDELEGVRTVRIYRQPGYVFAPLRRGGDRAGAVLVTAASREEALAQATAAADRIRFVTADAGSLSEAI